MGPGGQLTGDGSSLTRALQKASVSRRYASLYRDMKKSYGMSALPVNESVYTRAVLGYMLSVWIMPLVPSTSAR